MEKPKILVVDDDETFRTLMARELAQRGYEPCAASCMKAAVETMAEQEFDLALVDLRLPDGSGLDLLQEVRLLRPRTEVVMLTGHGSIDSAIEAMRRGASDYLRKPCPLAELEVTLQKALERQRLIERNTILQDGYAARESSADFVGESAAFAEVLQTIDRVAATDSTVLVLGETGVGKDVTARLIHAGSARKDRPFVVVECAALHEDLLHSELFGHEKGAYTGATQAKHGLFEVADKGTLFLDEIGDISLATQVKLLRVLETGTFRHVGGTREICVDVRIIAATNRNLNDLMERGFFRADLFYRLHTIRIEVPPLRRRPKDIAVLARHFLARLNARFGQQKRLGGDAMAALQRYTFPGNVRELLHIVEQAVILSTGDEISARELAIGNDHRAAEDGELLSLAQVERAHIERVLELVDGNRQQAARILEISERTLYRKLRDYEP